MMSRSCGLVLLWTASSVAAEPKLTIPLVPHHEQRRRFMMRRQLVEHNNNNVTARPTRYHRWLEGDKIVDDQQPSYSVQVAGLFQGYGTHYADLWCGTPPQRQTVIVDTGSGVTAFPCSECNKCGVPDYHIDKLFMESQSSTYTPIECGNCLKGTCDNNHKFCKMGQSYQEGSSWYAREVQDRCYVGGLHQHAIEDDDVRDAPEDLDPYIAPSFSFDLKFGCQNKITGLFINQLADGIMGMDKAPASYWKQMHEAGQLDQQAFSLCFSRSPTAAREGTVAGAMSLGGVDRRLHSTPMVYTDHSGSGSGFYGVRIRKAYLRPGGSGDSALTDPAVLPKVVQLDLTERELNVGNVIVDSGTTDTYFHKTFGSKYYAAFQKMSGSKFDHRGHSYSAQEIDKFPTILLQLSGDMNRNKDVSEEHPADTVGLAGDLDPDFPYDVMLAIPPSHYFEYDESDQQYYARFYADESRGSVLGANSMMGHDVLFDIDNGVLGWAESTCDYKNLLDKFFQEAKPRPAEQRDANDLVPEAKNIEPNDEERFKPEDEEAEEIVETVNERVDMCTGLGCQVSLAVALVGAVVLVGWRVARGTASDSEEELTMAELEMQTPPSGYYHDDDDELPS